MTTPQELIVELYQPVGTWRDFDLSVGELRRWAGRLALEKGPNHTRTAVYFDRADLVGGAMEITPGGSRREIDDDFLAEELIINAALKNRAIAGF